LKSYAAFIIVALLLTPALATADFNQFQIQRSDSSNIDYYIDYHREPGSSRSLLVFLHGSSCNSVVNIPSIALDYRNISPTSDFLVIDKYGIDQSLSYDDSDQRNDCPIEYIEKDSPSQRVSDARRVIDHLKSNYDHIIVVGGSEGAVITNLLVGQTPYISAAISFNGGGRWFLDDVVHNIRVTSPSPEAAADSIAGFRGFAHHVINNRPSDIQVSGHGAKWWQEMLSLDQLEVIRSVEPKLLIIQATEDKSVSAEAVDDLVLQVESKKNIEYIRLVGMNHGFVDGGGTSHRKLVVSKMRQWLDKSVKSI